MALNEIEKLIYLLSKMPGLGPRSGRRAALFMLKHKESFMLPLIEVLKTMMDTTVVCGNCGNIDTHPVCFICSDHNRDSTTICVVESIADLWAIERGKTYNGMYHVLGGVLSAIHNKNPEELNLHKLKHKVADNQVDEVIIATNATVDGQTTAYYITELLKSYNIKISRLAYGIPLGGELDYLDEGTLSLAIKTRQLF
jgi:recombination protein RecR